MGLTMGQRKAVTKAVATRYKRASMADKSKILDELCATTGWHRNHARKALAAALKPTLVRAVRRPRAPDCGPEAWVLQSLMTNYFLPQQKLISKVRDGAKVTKKYDVPTTPHRRADQHKTVTEQAKTIMKDTQSALNPAAIQRQIQALTS